MADGDSAARTYAIATSCRAKAAIVVADEHETGERALLNLGHTFGHALEAETGFGDRLLHGEGVAIGMVLAFRLSEKLGLCGSNAAQTVEEHFKALGVPSSPRDIAGGALGPKRLVAHMMQDKKVKEGRITFVLARGIGDAILTNAVDMATVKDVLREALS